MLNWTITFPFILEDIAREVQNWFFPAEESKSERLSELSLKNKTQRGRPGYLWVCFSALDLKKKQEIHSINHHWVLSIGTWMSHCDPCIKAPRFHVPSSGPSGLLSSITHFHHFTQHHAGKLAYMTGKHPERKTTLFHAFGLLQIVVWIEFGVKGYKVLWYQDCIYITHFYSSWQL